MKKAIWTILVLTISVNCWGQELFGPSWSADRIVYTTAKIKSIDKDKNGKYSQETFKTCTIKIEDANSEFAKVTIDMPDLFFIKQSYPTRVEYTKETSLRSILYLIEDEKSFCILNIKFGTTGDQPKYIFITFGGLKKTDKSQNYLLTEFKDN